MPKIRTNRTKPPPEGFEDIEGVLDEYERKMRDEDIFGKQLNQQHMKEKERTNQYGQSFELTIPDLDIFTIYITNEKLSLEIYLIDYADANLIAKWKRTGFEGLCCARCVQSRDMNYAGSVCICRVPKANLKPGTVVECVHCGCRGCASGD
ncbi:hypothetical protein MJO28_005684 [Puccinia striiformis f. sp. tritici]|uniref:Uncharacterized protein n=1 Tax=Puccinia striiformis f. sp. tritici TaxID=168172 RepID=A0ACC0EME8_9BASI|nr:hypothetical protein MJO28_005684 [Puccinia striiformis f. sp. tritici]